MIQNMILTAIAASFLTFSWLATAQAGSLVSRLNTDHAGIDGDRALVLVASVDALSGAARITYRHH